MLTPPATAGRVQMRAEKAMAGKVGTVWVQAGTDRLRASRINEISAAEPGQLALRVTGHRDPVVITLDGITGADRTTGFADRLLALIERHNQPRAASVVIGYQNATEGHLPYWRISALPGLMEVSRAPVDPDALPDVELTADQEAVLARLSREREQRLAT
jgi:hypothetical protein